ncbi:MAG: DUF4258 domain-containing protein [bacterium]|nr:DUF4258 domain-containing protein [bacterium]
MQIKFTKHAEEKFAVLRRHGVRVAKEQVLNIVKSPDKLDHTRKPLVIAQSAYDKKRVMRVVYKVERNIIIIITFYPGRKSQYEK